MRVLVRGFERRRLCEIRLQPRYLRWNRCFESMSRFEDLAVSVPICLGMVLCDAAVQDPFTHKYTLIGTFANMAGNTFPVIHPHMVIYVIMTDGHGKTSV